MKIYQIVAYYPPHVGGMEIFVERLSNMLSKKHSVEVITSDQGCKAAIKKRNKLTINYLHSFEIFNTAIAISLIHSLLRAEKKSVFHLHVAQAFFPEVVAFIAWVRKIPLISHLHLDVGSTTWIGMFLLPLYKRAVLPLVFNQSKKIIVQTQDYKQFLMTTYKVNPKKIEIVSNGIELSAVNRLGSKKLLAPYKLLFVGRMVNQKRPDLLIEAANILNIKQIPFILNIVGDGPELVRVKVLAKKYMLNDKVRFLGKIKNSEVVKLYHGADCFIQTSERESFSTVLLEAMNYGCPIVATDIQGTRNVLSDKSNAILVKVSKEDIAQGIEYIVGNNNLRSALIKGGYETVKKYGWNEVNEKIEKIYSDVLL